MAIQSAGRVTAIQSKYKKRAAWPSTKNRLVAGMSLIKRSSPVSALFFLLFMSSTRAVGSLSQTLLFWIQCEVHRELGAVGRGSCCEGVSIPLNWLCLRDLQGNSIPR